MKRRRRDRKPEPPSPTPPNAEAAEVERLHRENERLRKQLEEQAKRIADLERQLALKQQSSVVGYFESSPLPAAATTATPSPMIFEKDGYTWVGQIGPGFDGAGRLVEVVPAWGSLPSDSRQLSRRP